MIDGQRVSLRPFDRRHLEATRAWANDAELARLLDRSRPVSETEHLRWYDELRNRSDAVFFAVETVDVESRHIGNVWLWNVDTRHRKAELRILLGDSDSQGRGLGAEAIRLACRYAFGWLNLHKVYAYVLEINPRAIRAFQKAGFAVEGTLRQDRWLGDRYGDVYLLAVLAPPCAAHESAEETAVVAQVFH